MKLFAFIFVGLCVLACSSSKGQLRNTNYDMESMDDIPRVYKVYPKVVNKDVRGVCFINTDSALFTEYCKNIEISLSTLDGKVVQRIRTDGIGNFLIPISDSRTYLLAVEDRRYNTFAEKIYVNQGSELLLNLILKENE